jgi:hypothetical protein
MKSIFMSQVTLLLPHTMYITQPTPVNTNNKLQMQRQQPVNVMSPKLEKKQRQLLRMGKDMTRGVTVRQVLGQQRSIMTVWTYLMLKVYYLQFLINLIQIPQ